MPYWTPGSERYDIDAIRWLFQRERLQVPPASPIQAALDGLERMRVGGPLAADQPALHHFITGKMAQVLGWSIRVLWGEGAKAGATVDKTWVEQLLRPDLKGGFSLPSGVFVLWTAARWFREGGGTIRVCGNTMKGVDIIWTPDLPGRPEIFAECKDRAIARSLGEGDLDFKRYLHDKLRAATGIPIPRHGLRVLIVGFLTSVAVGKALRDRFETYLREEHPKLLQQGSDLPDAVAGNFHGMDYDEASAFADCAVQTAFLAIPRSPTPNPALAECAPLLRTLYGERGRDPARLFSYRSDQRRSIHEDVQPYLGMSLDERAAVTGALSRWARTTAEDSSDPKRVWNWRDLPPAESVDLWRRLVARHRAAQRP